MRVLRERAKTLNHLLPEPLLERLHAAGRRRVFDDGQMVHQRGDTVPGISIVRSGQLVAGNTGLDGSFLMSALLRPGDTFGEYTVFAGLPNTHSIWSQGRTETTFLSAGLVRQLIADEPAFGEALLTLTLLRNHELLDFVDAQRRFPMTARIAKLLLTVVDDDETAAEIECRHEDLAFMLGVSRVAIGKALKRLKQQGYVLLHYGRVEIPDVARLRALIADEDQFFPITRHAE